MNDIFAISMMDIHKSHSYLQVLELLNEAFVFKAVHFEKNKHFKKINTI